MTPRADVCLSLPTAAGALASLALVALAWNGWPGTALAAATDFCEAMRDGIVKQPANTWSNLGFLAVGLAAGARARRDLARGEPRDRDNPITRSALHAALFATAVVLLCPGSMAMHASTTGWGEKADVLSMYVFMCFPAAYGLARLSRLSHAGFALVYGALAVVAASALLAERDPGNLLFRALVIAIAPIELAVWRVRRDLVSERRWLLGAAGCFGVAYAVWIPSRTGGPLCAPDSWLQGHALWHLLCAGATACFYVYYRSERRIDA